MELSKLSDAADAADAADEQANVRKKLVILGVVAVLAVGIYFLFLRTPAPPSADSLATTALTASNSAERVRAVAELGQMRSDKGFPESRPHLLRIVQESKDGEVVATAIGLLASMREGQPQLYIGALENENANVREKGWLAIQELYPNFVKVGAGYAPGGSPESRKAAIRNLRKHIEDDEKRARDSKK